MSDFSSLSSSPRRVRQANVAAALQAIFAGRQLSRADLARQLGLNRSSSGNIISELIGNGLVREVAEDAPKPTRAGRPGILLELVPEGACFIGVEIGVEHITALRIGLTADHITRRGDPRQPAYVPGDPAGTLWSRVSEIAKGAEPDAKPGPV